MYLSDRDLKFAVETRQLIVNPPPSEYDTTSIDTKVIPLSDLQADPAGVLSRCNDSGQTVVVELPNHGLFSIQPVESDDDLINDLIEHNPAFRALLEKSLASPRVPFPFDRSEEQPNSSR